MNRFNLILSVLVFASTISQAQTNVFQSVYGGTGDDYSNAVLQTTDNGFLLAGWTTGFGAGSYDAYVTKVDNSGVIQWSKTFGNSAGDWFRAAAPTSTGGFIFLGTHGSNFSSVGNLLLVNTDANGVEQWSKTIGGPSWDDGWSVQQTADGGYILCGFSYSYSSGSFDIYIAKTDGTGNISWTRSVGGSSGENGRSVVQTSDGGYAVTGSTLSYGSGNSDVFLLKTNSTGDLSWFKTYGGTGSDWAYKVQLTSDNGFIIAGYTNSFGAGSDDCYIIKTDATGTVDWAKTYGSTGNDKAFSIVENNDGDFVASGYSSGFSTSKDILTFKLSSTGDVLWAKTYGGNNIEGADEIYGTMDVAIANGGYVSTAYTETFGAGNQDFYLIKTDEYGNSSCNEQNVTLQESVATHTVSSQTPGTTAGGSATNVSLNPTTPSEQEDTLCSGVSVQAYSPENSIAIYPNPVTNTLSIELDKLVDNDIKLSIYNSIGVQIHYEDISNKKSHSVNLENYNNGIYIIGLRVNGSTIYREIIIKE